MANHSSLNDTLDRMQALSSSTEMAKVKIRRPRREKPGSENVKNLLSDLLDDSAQAAEEEKRRRKEDRERAEEEKRQKQEAEAETARLEAEKALEAEKQAQEALKQHHAEMQAQVQRLNDIDAGLIDLEEEARQKAAEEARQRAEAEAKARKLAEQKAAEELKRQQESELHALRSEQIEKQSNVKKSHSVPIALAALAVVIITLVVVYVVATMPKDGEGDVYRLGKTYTVREIAFQRENTEMLMAQADIVKQAPDPKPVKRRPSKKSTSKADTTPKRSLLSSKGGIFGR